MTNAIEFTPSQRGQQARGRREDGRRPCASDEAGVTPDLDRLAQSAHAAYLADPGDRHAPEACPCKDGHRCERGRGYLYPCARCGERVAVSCDPGCSRCDPRLRAWPDLAESDVEYFRAQMRPALAVLGEARDEMRARLPARIAEREACAAILDADRADEERREARLRVALAAVDAETRIDATTPIDLLTFKKHIGVPKDVLLAVRVALADAPPHAALDAALATARAEVAARIMSGVGSLSNGVIESICDYIAPGWREVEP